MQDGLYISDTWVMPATGFALTFQGNDLTKPDTLQSSYSTTISLPDNSTVRRLTQQAQGPDSMSRKPYQRLPAFILDQGERVFTGKITLDHFQNGWQGNLSEEKKSLFDGINRSIRTGEFDRYNFTWTLDEINRINTDADSPICFPVVDYGTALGGQLPADSLFPAIRVHAVLAELLRQEGYSFAGEWLGDEFYKSLHLPFVEAKPTAHNEQWVEARRSRVTLQMSDQTRPNIGTISINRVQPYTIDNLPTQTWYQGKNRLYNTQTHTYVCDTAMHVQVNAIQRFKCLVSTGAFEVRLSVEKNGQEVAFDYWSQGGIYNPTYTAIDTVKIDTLVSCQPGDQLRIRLFAQRQTKLGAYEFRLYNDPENSWVSFAPTTELMTGDVWPVSQNLTSLTGLELLKSVAFLMGGTWNVDALRRQVRFVSLSETFHNRISAVDWSKRIDESGDGLLTPHVQPYAQKNILKFQDTDETKKAGKTIVGMYNVTTVTNYGDGSILCNAETLDLETTLFELPVGGCVNSAESLPGYGHPVLIPSRSVSYDSKGVPTVNKNGTSARLLLVDRTGPYFPVQTEIENSQGNIVPTTVYLRGAWFGNRPGSLVRLDNAFSLSFVPLTGNTGEESIIDRYYEGLAQLLKRPRTLTVSLALRPSDLASLDFGKPVFIGRVRAGSMYLNNQYYYLNKIANCQFGQTCLVTLIGF